VAVLLVRGPKAAVAWAGDSRIYRLRAGKAEQITHDHSHVQELLDQGLITPEQAEAHPLAHVITRAVGIDEALALQTARYDVQSKDRFLLCTDGLSRLLSIDEIERQLRLMGGPKETVRRLLQTALDLGAPDNVTIVLVEVG
jgi:serine/threonine protein phosphatase PrpC